VQYAIYRIIALGVCAGQTEKHGVQKVEIYQSFYHGVQFAAATGEFATLSVEKKILPYQWRPERLAVSAHSYTKVLVGRTSWVTCEREKGGRPKNTFRRKPLVSARLIQLTVILVFNPKCGNVVGFT
jgi:hypothetical protein